MLAISRFDIVGTNFFDINIVIILTVLKQYYGHYSY